MHRQPIFRKNAVIAIVIASIAAAPACRRAPEETATPPPEAGPEAPAIATLELPQHNPRIGISLDVAPAGLVATYNGEYWIELTDETRPTLRYDFVAKVPETPGMLPADVADFEALIHRYSDGTILGSGSVKTALGTADWSSGSFSEDGEVIETVTMFAPHPSGSGTVTLSSACPAGVATVEERLDVMKQLLAGIS